MAVTSPCYPAVREIAASDAREYTFFSDPTHLLGLHDTEILCIGEYWKNPVYTHTLIDRKLRNIRFVCEKGGEIGPCLLRTNRYMHAIETILVGE